MNVNPRIFYHNKIYLKQFFFNIINLTDCLRIQELKEDENVQCTKPNIVFDLDPNYLAIQLRGSSSSAPHTKTLTVNQDDCS